MTRLIALLLAAASASALAQHQGHGAPPADPHAGHAMPEAKPVPKPKPKAPPPASDPHVGHDMPEPQAADPHAGHAMPDHGTAMPEPPVAGSPPRARSGPEHAADALFDAGAMASSRAQLAREHGGITTGKVMIDRLEAVIQDGGDGYAVEGDVWYGGDIDKAWIKLEGEGAFGDGGPAGDVQALWSHAIDPWFDLQAGIRQDFGRGPDRTHLALGVQGLAPYWFEVDGALFLSTKGDLTARIEAEYDQRLTQKLILQTRIEFDLAAQDVPELGIGSGLSSGEIGLRLRYQIVPEFAPYVGVQYERRFGDTADVARAAGEDVGGWSLRLGVRTWF